VLPADCLPALDRLLQEMEQLWKGDAACQAVSLSLEVAAVVSPITNKDLA